jgi:hypothetical protein
MKETQSYKDLLVWRRNEFREELYGVTGRFPAEENSGQSPNFAVCGRVIGNSSPQNHGHR